MPIPPLWQMDWLYLSFLFFFFALSSLKSVISGGGVVANLKLLHCLRVSNERKSR